MIVPFVIVIVVAVAVPAMRLATVSLMVLRAVPEAVLNPSQLVEVPLLKVRLVNAPVDGVVAPMVVPLIVPPLMVTLPEIRLASVALLALRVVPDAVTNPSHPVEVTLVNTAIAGVVSPMEVLLMVPPVIVTEGETNPAALIERALSVVPEAVTKPNQPVEVAFCRMVLVPVALTQMKFWKLEGVVDVTVRLPTVRLFTVALVA